MSTSTIIHKTQQFLLTWSVLMMLVPRPEEVTTPVMILMRRNQDDDMSDTWGPEQGRGPVQDPGGEWGMIIAF